MTTKEPVMEFLYLDLEAKKKEFDSNSKRIAKYTMRNTELESDIKHLESTISRIHQYLNIDEKETSTPNIIPENETPIRKEGKKGSIADMAYELLSEKGHSMTIHEITKILVDDDLISTKAKNPMISVSSALSRDNRMKAVGGGYWSLRTNKDAEMETAKGQTHTANAVLDEDDEAESDANEDQRGEKSVNSIGSNLGLL